MKYPLENKAFTNVHIVKNSWLGSQISKITSWPFMGESKGINVIYVRRASQREAIWSCIRDYIWIISLLFAKFVEAALPGVVPSKTTCEDTSTKGTPHFPHLYITYRPYSCSHCPKTYFRKPQLHKHLLKAHPNLQATIMPIRQKETYEFLLSFKFGDQSAIEKK